MKSWLRNKFNYVKRLFSKREEVAPIASVNKTEVPATSSDDNQVTNAEGIALICKFEGYYPMPYLCPANVPTIGYGTTIFPNGEGVQLSDAPISEATAREYLAYDLKNEEDNLNAFLAKHNLELNSNQFSALVSFAYNLGFGAVSRPTSTVYKGLTSHDNTKVCYGIGLYTKANGKKLRGLIKRRLAEVNLFKKIG